MKKEYELINNFIEHSKNLLLITIYKDGHPVTRAIMGVRARDE